MTIRDRIAGLGVRMAMWAMSEKGTGKPGTSGSQMPLIPGFYYGAPRYLDFSFEQAGRLAMESNDIVFACVRLLMDNISAVPWVAFEKETTFKGRAQWSPNWDHDLTKLLAQPHPVLPGQDFLELITGYLYLGGQTAVLLGDQRGRKPTYLWPYKPNEVAVRPDQYNVYGGYQLILGGTTIRDMTLDEVMFVRFVNPRDLFTGLAPLKAAGKPVDTDNAQMDWQKNAMDNQAVPPGVFQTEEGLDDDIYNRLKKSIEERYSGTKNARRPFVAEKVKWQATGNTPVEMDYSQSHLILLRRIARAFRIPSVLLGDPDAATYANFQQAEKFLWGNTIQPFLRNLGSSFNKDLTPRWDASGRMELRPDLSGVSALRTDHVALSQVAQRYWQMGVPFSQINEQLELGFDTAAMEGAQTGYIPMGVKEVGGDIVDPTSKPADSSPEPASEATDPATKAPDFTLESVKAAAWKAHESRRQSWESIAMGQITHRFAAEKDSLLAAFAEDSTDWESRVDSLTASWATDWLSLLIGIYQAVIQDFGPVTTADIAGQRKSLRPRLGLKDAALPFAFDPYDEGIRQWIAAVTAEHVVDILDTTAQGIKDVIGGALDEGDTILEIAGKLTTMYDDFSIERAVVIARTETVSAANAGSFFAATQAAASGLTIDKTWISTKDDRTRGTRPKDKFDHVHADGQTVPLDQPFMVSGQKLMFPGDSSLGASAGNVIQCRCTQGYVVKDDTEEGGQTGGA